MASPSGQALEKPGSEPYTAPAGIAEAAPQQRLRRSVRGGGIRLKAKPRVPRGGCAGLDPATPAPSELTKRCYGQEGPCQDLLSLVTIPHVRGIKEIGRATCRTRVCQ